MKNLKLNLNYVATEISLSELKNLDLAKKRMGKNYSCWLYRK